MKSCASPMRHHRQRAQQQQPRVGQPRADAIAQPAHEQPRHDRDRHRADDAPADLILGELQLVADDRHQRRDAEPGEEAQKEGDPRHVERPHVRRREKLSSSMRVALPSDSMAESRGMSISNLIVGLPPWPASLRDEPRLQ